MQQRFISTFIAILFSAALLTLASCSKPDDRTYQKQVAVPTAKWDYKFQPEFNFEVPDTVSNYRVFLIFRYDAAFEFSNVWIRLKTKAPQDTTFDDGHRIETVLIAPDGSRLGNDVGGLFEYKMQLRPGTDFTPFSKAGKYTVKLEQIMRTNPLVGLLNIGLRVERGNAKQAVR